VKKTENKRKRPCGSEKLPESEKRKEKKGG
jgi:hypothetical protein